MEQFALVFDCDGTLLDSLGAALDSFNYALSAIGEPPRAIDEIKRFFGSGADRILTGLLGDEKKGLAAFEAYITHQTGLAPGMQLHLGIRELLEVAAAAQIPMAVVTGRHARDMEAVLNPHGITKYFEVMIADSQLSRSKPAPDGILLAAERLGVKPENVCYVGDSVFDLKAAHSAGSTAVAALWDTLAKEDVMRAEKPRFFAKTPHQVWPAFREFAGLA